MVYFSTHSLHTVPTIFLKTKCFFCYCYCFLFSFFQIYTVALIWLYIVLFACFCRLFMTQTPCMCLLRVTAAEVCGSRAWKMVCESRQKRQQIARSECEMLPDFPAMQTTHLQLVSNTGQSSQQPPTFSQSTLSVCTIWAANVSLNVKRMSSKGWMCKNLCRCRADKAWSCLYFKRLWYWTSPHTPARQQRERAAFVVVHKNWLTRDNSLAEIKDNPTILTKFHPQFWQEGAWLCCRQVEKLAPGCAEYNPFKDSKDRPDSSLILSMHFVFLCVRLSFPLLHLKCILIFIFSKDHHYLFKCFQMKKGQN